MEDYMCRLSTTKLTRQSEGRTVVRYLICGSPLCRDDTFAGLGVFETYFYCFFI
jgi:hypothetical protein